MATIAPAEAAVSAAPYSAIETMMYAATLPWPTESSQPAVPPKAKNRPAGKTRVKKMVRRLRSIRFSSMPSTVRLKPPNGGTLRAVGSRVDVVISFSSWVRLRKASSRPLRGDLEVPGVGLGQQVAGHGVAVLGVHQHGLAADLDAVDATDGGEPVGVGVRERGPDRAAGGQRTDLASRCRRRRSGPG